MALTHDEDWDDKNSCTGYETLYRDGVVRVQLAEETSRKLEIDNELRKSQPKHASVHENPYQESDPSSNQNLSNDVQSLVRWIL